MEIIELESNQVIRCDELVKITIGTYEGDWTSRDNVTSLRSGEICLSDEAIEVNSEYYHEEEFDTWGIVYDNYEDCYSFSDDCFYGYIDGHGTSGYFSVDADYLVWGSNYYIHSGVAEYYGIYHCNDCETTYNINAEDCGCEDDYCFSYHSGNREDFSKDSIYKIGFEIEKEDEEQKEYGYARDLFDSTGWAKETDGSLGSDGFELVSPILPLDLSKAVYEQDCLISSIDEVKNYINADYSKRCGGHINLSCRGLSSSDMLLKFKGYMPLFYAIYQSRVENKYCTAKKFCDYIKYAEKYLAFNCKSNNQGILEIRIFPAVKNVANLLWRAELIRIMLANPTESYKKALEQVSNPKNELCKHLSRVFNQSQLLEKQRLFAKYTQQFENFTFKQRVVNRNLRKTLQAA